MPRRSEWAEPCASTSAILTLRALSFWPDGDKNNQTLICCIAYLNIKIVPSSVLKQKGTVMDGSRFDELAKRLAENPSSRELQKGPAGSVLAGASLCARRQGAAEPLAILTPSQGWSARRSVATGRFSRDGTRSVSTTPPCGTRAVRPVDHIARRSVARSRWNRRPARRTERPAGVGIPG